MVFDELDQKILGLMEKFDFQNLTTIRNGLGGPNKNTPRPPPGKVKNSGGVRAKKARCSLAMESTKKLAKILTGLFSSKTTQNLRRNYTSFELAALYTPHKPMRCTSH